jgi:hypothetical protein
MTSIYYSDKLNRIVLINGALRGMILHLRTKKVNIELSDAVRYIIKNEFKLIGAYYEN